jgi:hypothetical protein
MQYSDEALLLTGWNQGCKGIEPGIYTKHRKEGNIMNGRTGLIAGVGMGILGGALMYWFDPAAGKRRRSHARYEARRAVRGVRKALDKTTRDLVKITRIELPDIAKALVPLKVRALRALIVR